MYIHEMSVGREKKCSPLKKGPNFSTGFLKVTQQKHT